MTRTIPNSFLPALVGMLLFAAATVSADLPATEVSETASTGAPTELQISHAISEAEVLKSKAQLELASLKLEQLSKLRQRGHATWQEHAQQERIVASLRAGHQAASDHFALVDSIDAEAQSSSDDAIRLFVPESTRLIAWVPVQHANTSLLERQLTNLREQHGLAAKIDTQALQTKVEKTQARLEHYSQHNDQKQQARATRARINHDLAVAELRLAKAHQAAGTHLQQRIVGIEAELTKRPKVSNDVQENEGVIAKLGTPFVTASNNRVLKSLANDVASLEANSNAALKLTSLLSKLQGQRVATLVKLQDSSNTSQNDSDELVRARQQFAQIKSAIQTEQATRATQFELIRSLQPNEEIANSARLPQTRDEFPTMDRFVAANSVTLRHFLELHRKWTSLQAARTSAQSDLTYLETRQTKLEEIPAEHRAPKELEQAIQNSQLAENRIVVIEESLMLLSLEAQRFTAQCQAQSLGEYQFVQAAGDQFVPRSAIKKQEAILSAVGFVGTSTNSYSGYVESPAIFRVLSTLTTSIRSQVSATQTAALINDGEIGFSTRRPGANSETFKTLPQTRGIRLATDGITYPRDLFNYVPSDLWSEVYPSSSPRQGYGYVPITYDRGIGRYASRGQSWGYSPTNFTSGPFDRSNFYSGVNAPGVVTKFYSRIPRYSDYYSFGIRRYDSPAGTSFRRGSRAYSPFYRPGFPTNFRY